MFRESFSFVLPIVISWALFALKVHTVLSTKKKLKQVNNKWKGVNVCFIFDLFKLDDRGLKFTKHPNVNSFFPVSFFNDINFY